MTALPTWDALRASAAYIASCQEPSGAIPWEVGGHTDPWDHVECAMALTAIGERDAAARAYEWLAETQRPDGTWPMRQTAGVVEDAGWDTNQVAYVAVGVWHHWLVHRDRALVDRMWPVVRAALDAVVAQQLSWGGLAWAVGACGDPLPTALLAGSSSVWHALDCGGRLASLIGERRPAWAVAQHRLARAIRCDEVEFEEKRRFSMDWYYPVLAGVVRGDPGRDRIERRWSDFVVADLGIRCVDDHPWVTGAETCELALAVEALGDRGTAAQLVGDMQHLRDEDGSYHTGFVYTDGLRWPIERSTWTAAAVILAVDAITDRTGGAGIFR